jgi:hypothetical protein
VAINANASSQVVVQVRGHGIQLVPSAAQYGGVVLCAKCFLQCWERPDTPTFGLITTRRCTSSKLHGMQLAVRLRMLWCAMVCWSRLFAALMLSVDRNSEYCLCRPMLHCDSVHRVGVRNHTGHCCGQERPALRVLRAKCKPELLLLAVHRCVYHAGASRS